MLNGEFKVSDVGIAFFKGLANLDGCHMAVIVLDLHTDTRSNLEEIDSRAGSR